MYILSGNIMEDVPTIPSNIGTHKFMIASSSRQKF